ncbi:MAG: hypothetical protein HKN87_00255 [Saprospiraceae bacterium]|nr:hypothetical protein [Saprospiraceae bacterium]
MKKTTREKASMLRMLLYAVILLLWGNTYLEAQDLPSEKVEVVSNFEARLADANKIKLEPQANIQEVKDQQFSYEVIEKVLPINYLPPTIKSIAVRTEELPQAYNGFVKAGFGYPLSPYLDAGYRMEGNDNGSNFLARLTHHSANDNNVENQRFSETAALLKGTYMSDYGFAVDGKLGASLDRNYFYGYDRSDTISYEKEDVQNRINVFELGAKIYNGTESRSKLNYWAGVNAYALANNFATRETGLNLDLGLTKWFGDNPLTIALGTDLTRLKDTTIQKLNNFFANPSFSFGTQSVRIKFGARLETSNEEYFFYPDVEVLLNVVGNNLSIFFGADGELRKNTFRMLSDYNPFLVSELSDLRNSSYYDFYAGVKGIVSGLEYSLQGGYKPTNDLALYQVNLEKPWMRFDVLYDTTNIIYFKGSIKGNIASNFDLSASAVYNIYDTKNAAEAWYLPQLQANVGVAYLAFDQKLRLKADVFVNDPVPFEDDLPFGEEPNLLLDVSLGADFFFTENVGLFLHLNNLAANNYRRWYNYPTYGLNVLGGITARF